MRRVLHIMVLILAGVWLVASQAGRQLSADPSSEPPPRVTDSRPRR